MDTLLKIRCCTCIGHIYRNVDGCVCGVAETLFISQSDLDCYTITFAVTDYLQQQFFLLYLIVFTVYDVLLQFVLHR